MSLVKKGNVFYAVIYVDGKQRWIRCGNQRREAKRKHDQLVVEAATGDLRAESTITFSEFADQWVAAYAAVRLKRSTYKEYTCYLRVHLTPYFGHMRLKSITPQMVQTYVAFKVKEGRLNAKSVRNHMVVMKRMLTSAVDWGLINSNPASKTILPRIPQVEMAFLTPEDVRKLLDATPEGWSRLLIATACLTGARKGELLALQHEDWSLEKQTITIKRTLYDGVLQEPKSMRSVRVLPMPASVAHMYETLVPIGIEPSNFVFRQADGTPLANGTPNRILNRALEKAGLEKVTFHALRHTFVALAVAGGVPIKVIQELAGHASIQTTLDRYGHLLPESRADAASAVEMCVFQTSDTGDDGSDPRH